MLEAREGAGEMPQKATSAVMTLPADATYGEICREFARRACFYERLSKGDLGERLGIQPRNVSTQVYRGQISLGKAMQLAEWAHASVQEMAQMERAWLQQKADKDVRGVIRRMARMIERYREEMDRVDAFLKKKGLWEEYVEDERGWDHNEGLVDEPPPPDEGSPKPRSPGGRKKR